MPGIEDDLLVGLVGMKGCDDAIDWIVEEDGADSDLHTEFKLVALRQLAEERLVLANGLAIVVENGPAAADPAGRPICTRLGLDFFLNLATESVGVTEGDLNHRLSSVREIADVCCTRQGGSEDGRPLWRISR